MSRVNKTLEAQVRRRAHDQCEYCQTQSRIVVNMTVDHILPRSEGGQNTLDNLCLACINCNESKHNALTGYDHITRSDVPLFNPRTQNWADHFAWSDDHASLSGLTPIGRATIEVLHINAEKLVEARRLWAAAGWHPPSDKF